MARGKTKLRKAERASLVVPAAKVHSTAVPYNAWDWGAKPSSLLRPRDSHHDKDNWDVKYCKHRDLDPRQMRRTRQLFSELFCTAFRISVGPVYRAVVQFVQDEISKSLVAELGTAGSNAKGRGDPSEAPALQETVLRQIDLFCREELAPNVLSLAIEDAFELLCDIAEQHGRNLRVWGPPCACLFSRCLPCLERLVEAIKAVPPMPAAKFRPGESPLLQQRVKAYKHVLAHTPPPTSGGKEQAAKEGSSRDTRDPKASSEVKSAWKAHGASVWAKMQSQIWQHASKTDPLAMPEVKAVLEALRKLDGLELYYKVLTHDTMGKAHRKDLISERNGVVYLRLSDHYERMKADNQTRDGRSATKNGTGWGADDWTGDEYRKAHARVIWEMGNKAYAASRFSEAKNEFTFASEFDPTEPVYRLNRAACGVKLKQFADAERDCTDSLALDPTNYKAYFRRGISRAALNKLEEAKRDFDEALRLEKDPKLQAELRKLSEEALKPSKPKRGSQPVQEDPTVQKDVIASISIAPEAASTEGSTNGKAVTITTTSGVTATIPCDSTVSSKGIDKGKGKAKDVEELPSANEIPDASLESSPATSTRPAGKIMFGSIAAVDDAATTNNAASTSAAMSPSSTWGSASAGTSASSSRSSAFGSPATSCVDVPEAGPSDASTKPATGLGLLDSAKVETVSSSIGTALKADSGSGASAMVTDAKPQAGCSAAPARPSRASKAGTQPASSLPAGLKTSTKRSATAQLHHTGSGRTDGQPNGGELGAAVAALEPEVTVLKSRLNAQRELVAWSTRAVEVVSQVEFARCFGMVVERETGVPRQTWIDGELAKLVAWIRTYVDEKREELQVGNQRNRAVGR